MAVIVTGVGKTIANLEKYMQRKINGTRNVVAVTALGIESKAKKRAPVDTGRLRSSIHSDFSNGGHTAEIGSNVLYAVFVEFGASPHFPPVSALRGWAKRHGINEWAVAHGIARNGTPAQPFLFPAFVQEKGKFIRRLRSEMSKL